MAITETYTHEKTETFEQYSFDSLVNPSQKHFVFRDAGEPWKLSLVQIEEAMTPEQVQELRLELIQLDAFMLALDLRAIVRRTEPGEPELNGIGGGL